MLQERDPGELNFAFRPSLVKRRYDELVGMGFDRKEAYGKTYDLCSRDLTYYFLEQFAKEKLVNFSYKFQEGEDGTVEMVSDRYEQFGDVCDMFKNTVYERQGAGLDSSREEAELEGLSKIKSTLLKKDEDAAVLLVSPPPEKTADRAGYGDYSFVYFGKYNKEKKRLEMHAWRNDMSLDEQSLLWLEFAGEEDEGKKDANDFLRSPVFRFGKEGIMVHDEIVAKVGDKSADFYEYRNQVDMAAKMLVDMAAAGASDGMMNLAQANLELDFIEILESGKVQKKHFPERIGQFASEQEAYMYVASRRQEIQSRVDLLNYSKGGCGSSVFASLRGEALRAPLVPGLAVPDLLRPMVESVDYFSCPNCNGRIESGKGITTCPHCGFTKEQAAEEMGIAC